MISSNKIHLKTIEVVSFQQNTLFAQNTFKFLYKTAEILKFSGKYNHVTGPASMGWESVDERGQDGKGKRERRGEGMKGREMEQEKEEGSGWTLKERKR
jgi:hypothetical protein